MTHTHLKRYHHLDDNKYNNMLIYCGMTALCIHINSRIVGITCIIDTAKRYCNPSWKRSTYCRNFSEYQKINLTGIKQNEIAGAEDLLFKVSKLTELTALPLARVALTVMV